MITRERAYQLRENIVKASASLPDEDALTSIELFPWWEAGQNYVAGYRVRFGSKLYKVVQEHTSQDYWTPDIAPALFTEVAPPGVIPVWVQPTGAQDAYMTGDRVWYPDENGSIYESTVDNNVWSPESYPAGWIIV